jgi:hypothetical protein
MSATIQMRFGFPAILLASSFRRLYKGNKHKLCQSKTTKGGLTAMLSEVMVIRNNCEADRIVLHVFVCDCLSRQGNIPVADQLFED